MSNFRTLNVLFAGHAQAGKSSLIESIVGKFPDNLDFELAHGTTATLKVVQFHLKKQKLLLNFLDSPGHEDFKGSIALGLEFADLLVLVISGSEGFQARTYWLYEKAVEKEIPIIIAVTKMDLPFSNVNKIAREIQKLSKKKIAIVETSAKKSFGIEVLVNRISIYVKARSKINSELSFIILGYNKRKGIGDLLHVGVLTGKIEVNQWLSDKIKIRHILSLKNTQINQALEGEIVQISFNVDAIFDLGTKYNKGKFISSKIEGALSEIQPRKEFYISIEDAEKFNIAIDVLENIKKLIPSFNFYVERSTINLLVLGDLQFGFIKERLEDLIEFKVIGSKVKGIITINKSSKANHKSASVRIIPRCRKGLTISRNGSQEKKLYDLLGASAAYEAFHLDGLHVDIYSGINEDSIAQAIAKAIEKVKIIKIIPYQDVIIKVENYHDVFPLIEKFNIEVLYQSQADTFFLQVKNQDFELFFNSLMKVSKGKADIHLFKFEHNEIILAVDPGTRHFGFCLIEKGELPSLWYVNLKTNIENLRTHNNIKIQLEREMEIFLGSQREMINKIFIGAGPGSDFIIEFFIEYLNIPCEDLSCVISDLDSVKKEEDNENKNKIKKRFDPPEIYLVDEFKTTKEALFHLQRGELVSEVKTKGFVDHAIAALLIAKRGIRGEVLKIEKKPLKQLYDYIIENYSGSYSFSSIHNVSSLADLEPGMYLRVKDPMKLDSNLNKGDIIAFIGWGTSGYKQFQAQNLSGNRILIKFQSSIKVKSDFFNIFTPIKERN